MWRWWDELVFFQVSAGCHIAFSLCRGNNRHSQNDFLSGLVGSVVHPLWQLCVGLLPLFLEADYRALLSPFVDMCDSICPSLLLLALHHIVFIVMKVNIGLFLLSGCLCSSTERAEVESAA